MAPVVGLISPILPESSPPNQRLPLGPTVIPDGPQHDPAVDVGYWVIACVSGLMFPIYPCPLR